MKIAIKTSKTISIAAMLTLCCNFARGAETNQQSEAPASTSTSIFKRLNQPFALFNCTTKNPDYFVYTPATNTLNITTCGTQDPSNVNFIHKITTPEEIERLVPIQQKTVLGDCNKQINTIFRGKREHAIGIACEELLSFTKIIPLKTSTDSIIVKEYLLNMPMEWIVKDAAQLKALCTYLQKAFDKANVQPSEQKTLLFLSMVDQSSIDEASSSFLNKHFLVLDLNDEVVAKFFDKAQSSIRKITCKLKDFGFTGESMAESIWRELETLCKDFDFKKIINSYTVSTIVSIVSFLFCALVIFYINDEIKALITEYRPKEGPLKQFIHYLFPKAKD